MNARRERLDKGSIARVRGRLPSATAPAVCRLVVFAAGYFDFAARHVANSFWPPNQAQKTVKEEAGVDRGKAEE